MKLPVLKKPTLKAPRKPAAKQSLRVPRFAEDLYRDMRDRRLLIPALALIFAIVAVPVALKAPKEDPPAAVAFTAPEGSEAVAPAVLTEQPIGVRDYRERLDELKSKNPFASNFSFPESKGGGGSEGPVTPDASVAPTVDVGSGSGGPPLQNTDTIQPDNPTGDAATDTPAEPAASGSGGGGGSGGQVLILAPRIDVSAGPVGNRKNIEDVEVGDLLPDRRKAPVVIFLGATTNLKAANFLVSGDVTETAGDGDCQPRANDCEFLRLRQGEKRSFVYEPTGRRYVVKVKDIREEVVDRRKVETD
jgi:hypothetical protein